MKTEKEKLRGAEGFERYYSLIFGARWQSLKAALLEESTPVPFDAGAKTYYLDSASILAANVLPLENAKNILDICAAPGGKTLVLAKRMERDAILVSNERSLERKRRLERVVEEHLLPETRERVKITCGDGAVLCKKQRDFYDAILLDAPCSSERHVLASPKYLEQWSPSRIKSLAMEQWALVSSAFRLLKTGGHLLYSTCAICDQENSDIIKRLVKKFEDCVQIVEQEEIPALKNAQFEKNELGFCVLPDAQKNAGPIYFSLVKKL